MDRANPLSDFHSLSNRFHIRDYSARETPNNSIRRCGCSFFNSAGFFDDDSLYECTHSDSHPISYSVNHDFPCGIDELAAIFSDRCGNNSLFVDVELKQPSHDVIGDVALTCTCLKMDSIHVERGHILHFETHTLK